MAESVLILAFLAGGQVALEENGEQVWSSDDDDEFTQEFGDSFHNVDDAEEIIEYLVDEGIVSEEEADTIEIDEESLNGEDLAESADA